MNSITEKIESVLKTINKRVSVIYCVGGFSQSSVVKRRMREMFRPDYEVKFPPEAIAAIMEGAVVLARDQRIIKKRISKYTIGLDWNETFDPKRHSEDKKERIDDGFMCTDIFRCIVRKGERIRTGYPVHEVSSYVKLAEQKSMEFTFYRSDISANPKYIDDAGCYLMGTMTVPFEDTRGGLDRHILLRVYIDEMLRAEAEDQRGRTYKVTLNMGETSV